MRSIAALVPFIALLTVPAASEARQIDHHTEPTESAAAQKDPTDASAGSKSVRWDVVLSPQLTLATGQVTTSLNIGAGLGARMEWKNWGFDAVVGLGHGVASRITTDATLGADWTFPVSFYRPAVGLELGALFGRPLRALDSESSRDNPYPLAFVVAPRLRVSPLVFRYRSFTFSGVGVALGPTLGGGMMYRATLVQVRFQP